MPDDPRDEPPSESGLWGDVFKELPGTSGRSGVRDRPSRILPAQDPKPAVRERPEPPKPKRRAPAPPDAPGASEPEGAAGTAARPAEPTTAPPRPSAPPPPAERAPRRQSAPAPPRQSAPAPPRQSAPAPPTQPAPARGAEPARPPPGWAVPRSPPQSGHRRHTAPWTVALVVLVLLVAGIGGFLLGGSGDDTEPGTAQGERTAGQRALARYDSRLESTVFTLNQRTERGRARLRAARTARGQARAATGLAGAYAAAARSLAGGSTPEARREANVATRSSLAGIARAYRALSRAARRGSRRGYAVAARTVQRRERALRASLRSPTAGS